MDSHPRPLTASERRLLRTKTASLRATQRRASRAYPIISGGIFGLLWLATMLASDAPWQVITGFWIVVWIGITVWIQRDARKSGISAILPGLESALRRNEADVVDIRATSYVELEEVEDEGACYAFQLDEERVVFISGQEFYPEAKFPSLDFSLVYVLDEAGRTVDMVIEKRGPKAAPAYVIPAATKERLEIPQHLEVRSMDITRLEQQLRA
jgi:hypothetical protein